MRVRSLIKKGFYFQKVEVEVILSPGLPVMQVIGLPDVVIKESIHRIKSAFNHLGFEWPMSQQILVHLKPSHIRKNSLGLDLAIAAALLWETGQLEKGQWDSAELPPLLYGEIGLTGEVTVPEDFEDCSVDEPVITGFPNGTFHLFQKTFAIKDLKDLPQPQMLLPHSNGKFWERPPLSSLRFSKEVAELMVVVALGEHPAIFMGPAGSGKSTVAQSIHPLLRNPDVETFRLSRRISREFGVPLKWRPLVQPHHTSTVLAMVGGGAHPQPGEITRAHGGVLHLDELLEFESRVQEALREPMESGKITISRCHEVLEYPADTLILATANLCKCGGFIPGKDHGCRCPTVVRNRYFAKLSGPILDRFALVVFSDSWSESKTVSLDNMKEQVSAAQHWTETFRKQTEANQKVPANFFEKDLDKLSQRIMETQKFQSQRQAQNILRVARTLADVDQSLSIRPKHLEKARFWVCEGSEKMRNPHLVMKPTGKFLRKPSNHFMI